MPTDITLCNFKSNDGNVCHIEGDELNELANTSIYLLCGDISEVAWDDFIRAEDIWYGMTPDAKQAEVYKILN